MDRILVVDDDRCTRGSLARILEKTGREVMCAANGVDALEKLATTTHTDLIITDIHMPHMDGRRLIQEVQNRPDLAATPAIFLSGYDEPDVIAAGFDAGALDFITKPFDPRLVAAQVSSILESRHRHQMLCTTLAFHLKEVMERLPVAAALVGREGVRLANSRMLKLTLPLCVEGTRIRGALATVTSCIERVICAALAGEDCPALRIDRFGRLPLTLTAGKPDDNGQAVLLTLIDPEAVAPVYMGPVWDLYDLTPTQRDVATMLVQGYALPEIQRELKITRNTANTHLRAMGERIGVRRQQDIIGRALMTAAQMGIT